MNYTLDTGLTFAVDEPAKVGRDRIADAAAAAAHYPLPCMTVDLGTATTYNVISDKKVFLGGFIVPGVQTSLRAISAGTAQLPPIAPEPPEHLIGANTVAALNNGAMFGTAAMLDGLADRVEAELGQPLTVVATGGLAPYIMPCCKRKIIYDADLLFKGLALIWERNGNEAAVQGRGFIPPLRSAVAEGARADMESAPTVLGQGRLYISRAAGKPYALSAASTARTMALAMTRAPITPTASRSAGTSPSETA